MGVHSTLPLPFATLNVGTCAMATLCSERSPLQNFSSPAAKAKANSPAAGALQGLSNALWGFQGSWERQGDPMSCVSPPVHSLPSPSNCWSVLCPSSWEEHDLAPISSTEPRASLPLTLSTRALAHSWPWPLGPSWREVPCARSSTGCED